MINRSVMAIARLITSNNSSPRLVALLPSWEEYNEDNIQIKPSGLFLIFLPFQDDIRHVELPQPVDVEDDLIYKAKNVINAISTSYHPSYFSNPLIQHHYNILQSIALNEDISTEDTTLPDLEGMLQNQKVFDEFLQYVEKKQEPPLKKTKTTKIDSKDLIKEEKNITTSDIQQIVLSNQLPLCTVSELKQYLKILHLPLSGKKSLLIEKINTHFGV